MIIIGERINSTRKQVQQAIKERDAAFILNETRQQLDSGADFIDVNCAMTTGDEIQDIDWVISVIQSEITDISICIDSPNYLAIDRALKVYKAKGGIFINSITGEPSRIKKIVPMAKEYNTKLIALTMDESGMPNTAAKRLEIAKSITDRVAKEGFNIDNLYFDSLIRPISTEPEQAKEFLKSVPLIKGLGRVKTICGLSNVSFGLPNRRLINSIFLSMAIHAGLDAAILDPTDKKILSSLKASNVLLGMDEYCAGYIKAFREEKLV